MTADELRDAEFSEKQRHVWHETWVKYGQDIRKEVSVIEFVEAAGDVIDEVGIFNAAPEEIASAIVQQNMSFLTMVLEKVFGCRINIDTKIHMEDKENEEL